MGGGAPLAFLNKKTWHPGRFQNQEEVWKREQQAAAEQRKLDELRKQYEDERKASEFTQMAEEAGYKRDAKLDWMYAGSLAAKQDADARHDAAAAAAAAAPATAGVPTAAALQQQQEQPLMAPRPAANESLSRAEAAARLPSFLAADTPASQNEAWARLNNDPLLAIKKQEQDSLRRVRDNPVKMQQILKEVEKVRSKHKKEKKEKKEKREKKDKKDKRGREHSSEGRLALSGAAGVKRGRSRSRSASPRRPPRPAAPPAGAPGKGLHHGSRPSWASDRPQSTAGGGAGGGGSRQQREPADRSRGGRDRSRSRSRSRERVRRGAEHREQHHGGRQQQADELRQQQPRDAGDRHHHHSSQHHSSSGRIGGGGGGSYGLDLGPAGARGGALGSAEAAAAAAERAAATRQRLAEAAAAKEAAAAAAAAAMRHQRRDYKAGGLSAEERAARLAEMTGNAAQHEQQRLERLSRAHAADELDRGAAALLAKAAAVRAEDAFKSAAAAEVFGSIAGGMSLDARISSRRQYHER